MNINYKFLFFILHYHYLVILYIILGLTNIMISSNNNDIKEALTCGICQDIVTLPVHGLCCEKAKSVSPACLSCVRKYCQLDKPPLKRSSYIKSWGGCGCNLFLQNKISSLIYTHTFQLDMVRNLLGQSICFHEECGALCETVAELRRHITGTSNSSDKNGDCLEAITKCKYCNFYGKRKYVNNEHYEKMHSTVKCSVCNINILKNSIRLHYNLHKEQMSKLKDMVHHCEKI